MFLIGLLFVIYCFLKFFFYGLYEFEEANNKLGGISICTLAILSTAFTSSIILYFYIL